MSVGVRYAGAIAIATVAVALRWLLVPWVGSDAPYATLRFSVKPDAQIIYRPGGVVGPEFVPLVWK